MFHTTTRIAELLRSCLSHAPDEKEANNFAKIGYRFALIRLRQQVGSGRLHLTSFQIPLEGLAYDCIADLFERDPEGRFPELETSYSGAFSPALLDDAAMEDRFRALIFTKVGDGIFRLYRENDPFLARIIRNLKIAVRNDPLIQVFERVSHQYLCACQREEVNDHLPEFPLDRLECDLAGSIHTRLTSAKFLTALFRVLNSQSEYRRSCSLIDAAVLLKRLLLRGHDPNSDVVEMDDGLLQSDLDVIVEKTFDAVARRLHTRYVLGGKLSEETFARYIQALNRMVGDTFLRNDGSLFSQPEYLQLFMPEISNAEYRRSHRTHFEYMAKLTKSLIRRELRELF